LLFLTRQKGTVAMEFALTSPIWLCLLFGTIDAAHLKIMSQRIDRIAYSLADIITQQEVAKIVDLDNSCEATQQLLLPFTFGSQGRIIVTSVYKETGYPPKIVWQYTSGHCGALSRASLYGLPGTYPSLGTLTLNDNDNIIISEVFFDYHPLFPGLGIFSQHDLYRATFYKPRLSPLVSAPT
ncbi:MAG: tight adherence pilus pseudopilin TadF, partial [Alphaproteobacteria bacterium]|nr:tight adherence pilus pseudopilin TadF [Alphaproteobacteria bacterium]